MSQRVPTAGTPRRSETYADPRLHDGGWSSVRRIARDSLTLLVKLYLQPERFARKVDELVGEQPGNAASQRRSGLADSRARRKLAEGIGATVLGVVGWLLLWCGAFVLAGVPLDWAWMLKGAAAGLALGLAVGWTIRVATGIAIAVTFGAALGVAGGLGIVAHSEAWFGVVIGIAAGLAAGVSYGVAFGVGRGLATGLLLSAIVGLAFGMAAGLAGGIAYVVAFLVAALRLVLAPLKVAVAVWLDGADDDGDAALDTWRLHPARWDPHGRFPLPGLTRLLARLQIEDPRAADEAHRIVVANPTRRGCVAAATLLAADRTVARINSFQGIVALAADVEPFLTGELLEPGERSELRLLRLVSDEATASRDSESIVNRVSRLRAARKHLDARNAASAVIVRRRRNLIEILDRELDAAECEQREFEPVPPVFRSDGTPLELAADGVQSTFTGRSEIFMQLEELLGATRRATVVLHGPRRIGKTSVLKQMPQRLGPSVVPVFVDLQANLGNAESAATLLEGIAHEIVIQARSHRDVGTVPALERGALTHEPYVDFTAWLDALERSIGDRHILLCLDEYETLERMIQEGRLDTRVLGMLRGIVQHRARITVALTGIHAVTELPDAWAAALLSTIHIELDRLTRGEAERLVVEPVPDFPAVYSAPALDAILEATAHQPYLLQVLCSVLVDELNGRRWNEGDPQLIAADVERARPAAVERADVYFEDMWRDVPSGARAFMRKLAQRGSVSCRGSNEELLKDVFMLERRHAVTCVSGSRYSTWALTIPMFGDYIRLRQSVTGRGTTQSPAI